MPFSSLIVQPYEVIQEYLKIKPGSYLDFSLSLLYSFIIAGVIDLGVVLAATTINPIVGIGIGTIFVGVFAYELYKGLKGSDKAIYLKKKKMIEDEGKFLFNRIIDLFGDFNRFLEKCNVIEFRVDESFNSIVDGIFNYSPNKKVKVIFWNIPGIPKARTIRNFPEKQRQMYSVVIKNMSQFKDSGENDFNEIYENIKKDYNNIYKEANTVINDLEIYKKKEEKRKEIFSEIDELSKFDKNDPRIEELYSEIRELN